MTPPRVLILSEPGPHGTLRPAVIDAPMPSDSDFTFAVLQLAAADLGENFPMTRGSLEGLAAACRDLLDGERA